MRLSDILRAMEKVLESDPTLFVPRYDKELEDRLVRAGVNAAARPVSQERLREYSRQVYQAFYLS